MILEDDRGRIAINPDRFDKLITAAIDIYNISYRSRIWKDIIICLFVAARNY